jgi:crotonobetainyl-CoA:carnitine CoA-transferase CaiB-like acyl-CoA transferase
MMLSGIRVLELGQNVAAPYASSILADLGAEVVKVEKAGGEEGRKLGPPFAGADPAWFHQVNRNKKSVVIDIKSDEGRERLLRLMESADVFLHNVRPGALVRSGLGPDVVRARCPHLVYIDATAFGHVGPLSANPGYELLMQASAGLMSVTGGEDAPPTRAGPSVVDLTTGMWMAIGALAALVHRERDSERKGAVVNTSLYESALALSAVHIANYSVSGKMPTRTADGFPGLAPYGGFKTRDKDIIVGGGNDGLFGKLARLLGKPEWTTDERFKTNVVRVTNKLELNAMINEALSVDDAASWLKRLEAAGIPCAPIRAIPDVIDDPQTIALGMVTSSDADPSLKILRSPLSFDGERLPIRSSAPRPGQNDDEFR